MTALWVILLVISIIILLYTLIMMAQPPWNRPKIFRRNAVMQEMEAYTYYQGQRILYGRLNKRYLKEVMERNIRGCLTGVIAFVILIFAIIMLVRGCS